MSKNTEKTKIPNHVGMILDGNRRWAKENGKTNIEGHYYGKKKAGKAVEWFFDRGVNIVSLYVFSNENWNRAQEEIDYLMKLLREMLDEKIKNAEKENYKVLISGRIDELPGDLADKCRELIEKTKNKDKGIVNFCLNYGGRGEIVDAFKKMLDKGVSEEDINEDLISQNLYNHEEIADPDIIIRTSGEKRISGFQLWRSAYSEFLFLDKYWPEISEEDADLVIEEFSKRKRRFGGDESR